MSAYLLTYNPEYFAAGYGSDVCFEDYKVGDDLNWSCRSTKPQLGDMVYLMRVGKGSRGIIAKGVVTRLTFEDKDWQDDQKKRSYIGFQLEAIRPSCADGLLSILLLNAAMPKQSWSPQFSGIEIASEYESRLSNLWDKGAGEHSLTQLMRWEREYHFNQQWYVEYQRACQIANNIKKTQVVSDEDATLLWRIHSNGIGSAGQGTMSEKDFVNNLAFLKKLTLEIVNEPTDETYKRVFDVWKTEGTFSKTLFVVIRRLFAAAAPEEYTCIVKGACLRSVCKVLDQYFDIDVQPTKHWLQDNRLLLSEVRSLFPQDWDVFTHNILLWCLYERAVSVDKLAGNSNDQVKDCPAAYLTEKESITDVVQQGPKNIILFGPPGTGKTYHTINKALEIIDPDFLAEHQLEEPDHRALLKRRFDELVDEQRIRFTTFHQSFSYEDFVEGIKAETDVNSGQIRYEVVDGIFKLLSTDAASHSVSGRSGFDLAVDKLLEKIEEVSTDCIELKTPKGKVFNINYDGGATFKVYPRDGNENANYVANMRNVRKLYMGESKQGMYNVSYVEGMLNFLKSDCGLPELDKKMDPSQVTPPFVLIIDEINRGNVSRIFGELITLIEPSKRQGQAESLSVVLPYSKERFSVPDNLYIIGTMNTADRSLSGLDIALRRRFVFEEMPPCPKLLNGVLVEGSVNMEALLSTLNQRIEVLLDRDHCLGHAYFMPLKNEPSLKQLSAIFQNQILPLLQEYFFEDWQRIAWVLNDHRKADSSTKFLLEPEYDIKALLGDIPIGRQRQRWMLNLEAFHNIDSYLLTIEGDKGIL